jgi:ribonuclease HI
MTHAKPCPSIEGSRRFLTSYLKSFGLIKHYTEADIIKGKMAVDENFKSKKGKGQMETKKTAKQNWKPPIVGSLKLNADGAYKEGEAGAGMVLRTCTGEVVFSACRSLQNCRDAMQAELDAIEEGLKLALQWSNQPVIVETDCAEALTLIQDHTPNTSVFAFTISSIRELLREREGSVSKTGREANGLAHELAKMGRVFHRTEFWLADYPPELAGIVSSDCNFGSL